MHLGGCQKRFEPGDVSTHTAIRILLDVSSLRVDHSLHQLLEVLIVREKLVQVGELVTRVSQPLSTANVSSLSSHRTGLDTDVMS